MLWKEAVSLSAVASTGFARDPFPFYSRWRANAPVQHVQGSGCWIVLGYDDALRVLRDHTTFSSSPNAAVSPSLNGADSPAHTVLRKTLQPYFSAEQQLGRRARVREIVRERLDRLRGSEFDAIADFSAPVAHTIACDWLGMNEELAAALRGRDVTALSWNDVEGAIEPDGLLARLASSGSVDQSTVAELAGFFLMAGVETARESVLFTLLVLRRNRQVVTELATSPATLRAYADEFLRLEPPAHTLVRLTRSEVELSGIRIPAGATVWVSIAAANRDPLTFPEPDVIDRDRRSRHLTFSAGPHFCPGNHLGQMEGEVMLSELLPDMERLLDQSSSPEIRFVGIGGAPALRQIVRWKLSLT